MKTILSILAAGAALAALPASKYMKTTSGVMMISGPLGAPPITLGKP